MNIFILDYDIKKSVQYHCDQHINKMILEAAQMICTVQFLLGNRNTPYKPTHPKHPCTIWTAMSLDNYIYTMDYAFYLNEEAKRRYNRKVDHKSWNVIEELPFPKLPTIGLTTFARAMPEEFKSIKDPIEAYRQYYKTKTFATWSYCDKPDWY